MRPQFARRHPAPTAEEINALRLKAGLTMAHLAKLIGVSTSTVEAWCYGRNIMPEPMWRLAKLICAPRIKKRQAEPPARRKIVIAGTYQQYKAWLHETNTPSNLAVYVDRDEQLMGLELKPEDVVLTGEHWLNPINLSLLKSRIR